MFRARPAGPARAVDREGRRGRAAYRRRRRHITGARGSTRGGALLARVVHLVVGMIPLIIVGGILFVVLEANPTNTIVLEIHDWARSLARPFDGTFSFHSAHVAIAVNRGIAAVVYLRGRAGLDGRDGDRRCRRRDPHRRGALRGLQGHLPEVSGHLEDRRDEPRGQARLHRHRCLRAPRADGRLRPRRPRPRSTTTRTARSASTEPSTSSRISPTDRSWS
jgi:hypothetical protein